MDSQQKRQGGWALKVKRLIDLGTSTAGLVATAPLMAATAAAIRLSMGKSVLFKQPRPGKNGDVFTLYKFRTMREATDDQGRPLPDAERLTRVGEMIRKASLDELPQLFNILLGDMSLVGPRPLLVRYLDRYNPRQHRRHEVLPGITGWAQVNGRNATTWDQRFDNDLYYVDNWSLALDLKILALTALKVLRRDGVAQTGQATMAEFMGNDDE